MINDADNGARVLTIGPSLRQKMGVQGQGDCSFPPEVEMGREVRSRCSETRQHLDSNGRKRSTSTVLGTAVGLKRI